ncbi:hypothetical protein ACFX13_000702 [Malus domestica]
MSDGKSFATRRVDAIQKGINIFTLLASFKKEEEGFVHQQATMPSVPAPDKLLSMEELREKRLLDPRLLRTYRFKATAKKFVPWPIEIRSCEPNSSTNQTKSAPSVKFWFRAIGKLSDDQALHRCVVAYASDLIFLGVSLNPHRLRVSLDHAIWFHRPVRADEWLLYVIVTPIAYDTREFVSGQMFNIKGEELIGGEDRGSNNLANLHFSDSQGRDCYSEFNFQHATFLASTQPYIRMELPGDGSDVISQTELTQEPLLCGLPDDIALFCLARVPRKYHTLLKCVSKRWRDLVCSEEWHSYRRKHKLDETWIYALCRDKLDRLCFYVLDPNSSRRSWKLVHGLPPRIMKRKGMGFEVIGNKVYLLGGCGWCEDATDEVYCYDASLNAWSEASPLSTARCYFACEILDDKIYSIGGLGSISSYPHSWDIYDPCTDSWKFHSDPNIVPEIEDSVVMAGKIYIRCGTSAVTSHVHAVVYEPSSGTWQHADSEMVSGWRGPAVVIDGTLYVLDQSSGTRLMMWEKETREWIPVGRLSSLLTRPPCQLVAIGKKFYVVGKGLSTVMFDVENAGNMEGVMVSSSIPKLNSNIDVIGCKCLSI